MNFSFVYFNPNQENSTIDFLVFQEHNFSSNKMNNSENDILLAQ